MRLRVGDDLGRRQRRVRGPADDRRVRANRAVSTTAPAPTSSSANPVELDGVDPVNASTSAGPGLATPALATNTLLTAPLTAMATVTVVVDWPIRFVSNPLKFMIQTQGYQFRLIH